MRKDKVMANIRETISEVQKLNPELARQIEKFVKDHSYGLVFERNLPEAVRLYTKKPAVGDTVNIRPKRGSEESDENKLPWIVKDIRDNLAIIEKDGETKEIPVEDIVTIVSFKDTIYPGLKEIDRIERGNPDDPYHMVINSENYHALEALTYAYAGKVDCIYIDPPYNKETARDWKYNCNYVDGTDKYRHSKWLAFIERRLKLASKLLNPENSILIVTIDEKEYLRLGLLLEQMFHDANIQMIVDVVNPRGTNRDSEFSRVEEYVFICRIGSSVISKTGNNMLGNTDETGKARVWYGFNRGNNSRSGTNGQFFPIYIDPKQKKIVEIGEPLSPNAKQSEFPTRDGLVSVFPINSHGEESIWGAVPKTTREWVRKGYIRVSDYDKKVGRWTLSYIRSGMQKRIEAGEFLIDGKASDGSLNIQHIDADGEVVPPKTVWYQKSHKSYDFGSTLLKDILPGHDFPFPKSLYSVHDALKFAVKDNPNSLIIDFFAGSGTTLHAINLINAEDDGHRRCICITNNELKASEQDDYTKKGLRQGDEDWEKYGIARYITWPRTKCTIEGKNVNGTPLEGTYGCETEEFIEYDGELIDAETEKKVRGTIYQKIKQPVYPELAHLKMSDGFKANAIFCELTYESAWNIRLDQAFNAIAPILWMLAGCRGEIIRKIGKSYLTTDYYGVLFDYGQASKFCEKIKSTPSIKTAFVVTDDQRRYSNMCKRLPGIEVHRLYESFLKTFEICGEGGLD